MPHFLDRRKQRWDVAINGGTAYRVKQRHAVDLLDVRETLPRLATDPVLLTLVLFECLDPKQLSDRRATLESFLEGFGGETYELATEAFLEALTDFFPPRLKTAAETTLKVMRKAQTMLDRRLAEATRPDVLEPLIERALSGSAAGNSGFELPELSASIPHN